MLFLLLSDDIGRCFCFCVLGPLISAKRILCSGRGCGSVHVRIVYLCWYVRCFIILCPPRGVLANEISPWGWCLKQVEVAEAGD
ncbi:hypothetical protein B0O80DRAFT_434301 [Mortierella sp. GBAus27b]|nr:hypothetical protein B0O80DRAFT_434301 [Mortierella sp. GBAus27b]